jgi:MoaA/NifB/PqqE/SkfB family radical SAM enzyme
LLLIKGKKMTLDPKFSDPLKTAKGNKRASVPFQKLKTLWFNTGSLCNLECRNCYLESGPRNDRLSFLNKEDVIPFLQEIKEGHFPTDLIGLTGGEPFLNPQIFSLLEEILSRGHPCLVLTNAYKVISKWKPKLLEYNKKFSGSLFIRVSLDHYSKDEHEKERGKNTFYPTLQNLKWFVENQFKISIAGRFLKKETIETSLRGFQRLLDENNIPLLLNGTNLVLFPEMKKDNSDTPEITTDCWTILNKKPESLMCATERMIVKLKGEKKAKVQACTLIPYKEEFQLGYTLKESFKKINLNHPYCSSFCLLGGSSCSKTY